MITDNKIIQTALAEHLTKVVGEKIKMLEEHYDKRHDKYCFTSEEMNSLLKIQKNQTKTYELIKKFGTINKTA